MGGGLSVDMQGSEEELFRRMLPSYYIKNVEFQGLIHDVAIARASWEHVKENTSPSFLERQGSEGFPSSCLSWFYDVFYLKSSELDEGSKSLYKDNLKVQVKALVSMIQLLLNLFKDKEKTDITLTNVANGHTKKGVKAYQYGIIGEILVATFHFCLGETFTEEMSMAWFRILSYSLSIILPVAIANDKKEGGNSALPTAEDVEKSRKEQSKRLQEYSQHTGKSTRVDESEVIQETPDSNPEDTTSTTPSTSEKLPAKSSLYTANNTVMATVSETDGAPTFIAAEGTSATTNESPQKVSPRAPVVDSQPVAVEVKKTPRLSPRPLAESQSAPTLSS